jgi:hypothetical protein
MQAAILGPLEVHDDGGASVALAVVLPTPRTRRWHDAVGLISALRYRGNTSCHSVNDGVISVPWRMLLWPGA